MRFGISFGMSAFNATIVAYTLARALFDELDDSSQAKVIERALGHLPPTQPDQVETPLADQAMWWRAQGFFVGIGSQVRAFPYPDAPIF
jgi:hypothetical protein